MLTTTPAIHRLLAAAADKQEETYICDLPEEIMDKIVSNLTVREVVRVSLTCKQWLHLPARLDKILFRCGTMTDSTQPHLDHNDLNIRGVNQFILSYKKLQAASMQLPLHDFGFCFCLSKDYAADIERWICFAIEKGVKKLDIFLGVAHGKVLKAKVPVGDYIFPCHLLNRSQVMLRRLSLMACVFGRELTAKCMFLEHICLVNSPLTRSDLDNIFSCCPNLKNLVLVVCNLPAKVTVAAKCLIRLRLEFCSGLQEIGLLDGIPLVQLMHYGPRIKFSVANASNLFQVFFCMDSAEGYDYVFQDIHRDFPCMKWLYVLRDVKNLPSLSHLHGRMYAFQHLEALSIFCCPEDNFSLLTVLEILKACPLLRRFNMMPPYAVDADNGVKFPVTSFHRNLKSVLISGFCGTTHQIDLAIMLIQASSALGLVVIEQKAEVLGHRYGCFSSTGSDTQWRGDRKPRVVKLLLRSMMRRRGTLRFFCYNAC